MASVVKLRRGTTLEHSTFTGAIGEVSVDITKDTLVIHDGVTAGGHELALANLSNTGITAALSELNILDGAVISTTELNYLSGVSSNIQTQLDSKATTASLSTVATSGLYSDLSGTPTIPSIITDLGISDGTNGQVLTTDGAGTFTFADAAPLTVAYSDITGKPTFATVATTGDYTDLINTPTIPVDVSELTDSTNLLVHFSGDYTDLTNKPTIPSLTGYATETYVDTVLSDLIDAAPTTLDTLNELAAALGDDPNFATTISTTLGLKANSADLATVATSGDYTDLINTPTVPIDVSDLTDNTNLLSGVTSYNDLSDKPTIPVDVSDLTDTTSLLNHFSGDYTDLTNAPVLATVATTGAYSDIIGTPTVPADVNELADSSGLLGTTVVVTGGGLDGGDASGNGGIEPVNLGALAAVALSGAYADITGTPTLSTVATSGAYADITGTPTLATVATTGSYNDLSDLPSVATPNASHFSNDYILYGTTSDAVETEILVDGATRISITANSTVFYEIDIVARRTDGGANEGGAWHLKGSADNYAGITGDVGNLYEIVVSADDVTTTVDARVDDVTDTLRLYVTGAASKTFKWTAKITTVEVIG